MWDDYIEISNHCHCPTMTMMISILWFSSKKDDAPYIVTICCFLIDDERRHLVQDVTMRISDKGKLKKGSIYKLMDQYEILKRVTREFWAI